MTKLLLPPVSRKHHRSHHKTTDSSSSFKARFEAYNRLQAAAVAFGEKLPIPEIVSIGGQSDGKSSLLEALLWFRFNVREVEMGTRRPLILQMVHDPTALDPRCRFRQCSSEYGGWRRWENHDVCAFPAVGKLTPTRTAYRRNNVTLIHQMPSPVQQAKKGEPESTPDEILSMVKSLASPPHRIIVFLQQSSVEWCSSLWLHAIREIDPTFRRTIIVVSKYDNRLKEFTDRWEVDSYLSASGYLGENTHPFFVALPKHKTIVSNDEFRRQITQVDTDYLDSELQKRYKEAAPATLALLEQRCSDVTVELNSMDSKIQANSDVAHLRRSSMLFTSAICNHLGSLIEGSADHEPEKCGKTTEEEKTESGFENYNWCYNRYKTAKRYSSIECPPVLREKVANIILAHAGRGGGRGIVEAVAELARSAARSWLAPLIDSACERLAFVLRNLYVLAVERNRINHSDYTKAVSGNKRKNDVLATCLQQMKACFLDGRINKVELFEA